MWSTNPAVPVGKAYSTQNIDSAGYSIIYFYTDKELSDISKSCESVWDNNRETQLQNLSYNIIEPTSAIKYNVELNANGGEGTKTIQVKAGNYTLPTGKDFTRDGYDFIGWSRTANGEKIEETSINVSSNITLYAVWTEHIGPTEEWIDATMTAGANSGACTVNNKKGIKCGTSSKAGSMTITVTQGATKLRLYAAAWNGVTGLSLNISGATVSPSTLSLKSDSGISNNSPFTLVNAANDYYFEITLSNINEETTLTFTGSSAKRFVVWNAQYK